MTWQPLDEKTSFGPLISSQQRDKVLSYVESGVSEGATLATGGKKWGNEGFFVEPTVLSNCKPSFKCVREEVSQSPRGCHTENRVELTLFFFFLFGAPLQQIFGPVASIIKFSTEEEVLELANSSIYGLGAGVFTSQSLRARKTSSSLRRITLTFATQMMRSKRCGSRASSALEVSLSHSLLMQRGLP